MGVALMVAKAPTTTVALYVACICQLIHDLIWIEIVWLQLSIQFLRKIIGVESMFLYNVKLVMISCQANICDRNTTAYQVQKQK